MANEKDASRSIGLMLTLVLAIIVVLAGGGYWLWSWLGAPPAVQSRMDINRVAATASGRGVESPAYRELLQEANEEGAEEAKRRRGSFVASMPLQKEPITVPVESPKPTAQPRSTTSSGSSKPDQAQTAAAAADKTKRNERRQADLDELLAKIKAKPVGGLKVAGILGGADQGGNSASSYQSWSESLPGNARSAVSKGPGNSDSSAGIAAIEIVPPYWRGPGFIDLGVDSDNSTTPVLAKLETGTYAGARFKAPDGARLTGEGVVIHFTEMAYRGINYKVDAYALQEDTLLANVATEVNHRYMSRIVLPAVLSGIGGIGQMYAQANTQLVTNGFSTQTVRPQAPDGQAVLGAVAGGAAGQAAKVLSEDAARMPATQVMVKKGQVVAVQFMRGVYAGDAIAPGQTGELVRPSMPPQAEAPGRVSSTDQWRAQTEARIEAQRKLQEIQ